MGDHVFSTRQLAAIGKRAPDVVLEGCGLGCRSGHIDALCSFDLDRLFWSIVIEWLEEVCRGKDSIGALKASDFMLACDARWKEIFRCTNFKGFNQSLPIVNICLDDFHTTFAKCDGLFTAGISRQTSDLIGAIFESGIDEREALSACSANDGKKFRHYVWCLGVVLA